MFGNVTMRSGRLVDLSDIDYEKDICMEDIIWHHSRCPRWNCHTAITITVAEHVLYCDDIYMSDIENMDDVDMDKASQFRLDLLLHDAAETFTNDIPTGVKTDEIRELQDMLDDAIRLKFGMHWLPDKLAIKKIDDKALIGEARSFMDIDTFKCIMEQVNDNEPPDMIPGIFGPDIAAVELRTRLATLWGFAIG